MMFHLGRALGLLPDPPKTGGREAGLLCVFMATLWTVFVVSVTMAVDRSYWDTFWPLTALIWGGAFTAFAVAFGLKRMNDGGSVEPPHHQPPEGYAG